jgi:hypothetical protein
VLLAKTLRSSTFKWALIWITIFGAVVIALFGYVYWSTATYVRGRSNHAIAAEQMILRKIYDAKGRGGLIAAIEDRITNERSESGVYLLADPSFAPLAGNLKVWPSTLKGSKGWEDFIARDWKPDVANPCERRLIRSQMAIICWSEKRSTISMSSRRRSRWPSSGASF